MSRVPRRAHASIDGLDSRRRFRRVDGKTQRSPNRSRFDRLVARALQQLPRRFRTLLNNVAIVVADEPTPIQRASVGLQPTDELYGLYEGVPRTNRDSMFGGALPDKITLFQRAIEKDCRNEAELLEEIRHTLIHEVAHHFGIDDARLDTLGYD